MIIDFNQNIFLVSKTKDKNGTGNSNGECPNEEDCHEGFAFRSISTTKWSRDVKETIDGQDRQMPNRCRAEKNIEEHIEITNNDG